MANATPILSIPFMKNYGLWLLAIFRNSACMVSYLFLNSLIISLIRKMGRKDTYIGTIAEEAPYYLKSFPPCCDGSTDDRQVPCQSPDKAMPFKRKHQNSTHDDITSEIFLDYLNPAVKMQQFPYYFIEGDFINQTATGPKVCLARCNTNYAAYYITIIAYIMIGYRTGLKYGCWFLDLLLQIGDRKGGTVKNVINKFFLLLGAPLLFIVVILTIPISLGSGLCSSVVEKKPSAWKSVGDYEGSMWFVFTAARYLCWLLNFICTVVVACCALATGIFMWWGLIPLSIFIWLVYPIIEKVFFWDGVFPSGMESSRKLSLIDIGSGHTQFYIFLFLIIMMNSASTTMDNDFNTGIVMVFLMVVVSLIFKSVF